ncbi:MAG TPA: methyltransferase domain-containing protein [Bacteroidales bacterium]|nr:methyltransferase domain-containing protein [Bacteroidales bacterium]
MQYKEIDRRYSELAEEKCCLSCGGAMNHTNVSGGETCVDLGSGRGTDVIRLAEKTGPSGFVYGIDISEGMIRKSIDTAQRLGMSNVKFIHCALEKLVLTEQSVDLVISNCTINHSLDKQSVWNEVYRILKTGGRFVISDIYSRDPVPEEYSNDPVAIAECWAGSVTRDVYLKQLKKAGFRDVKIIEESDFYEKGKISVASWTLKGYK